MRIVLVFTLLLISKFSISQNRCVDNQGNSYKTIKIGNQVWMAENLRVTTYNDGTPIERQYGSDVGFGYENRPGKYYSLFGDRGTEIVLYDWFATNNSKGIAPEGFRIPTKEDWETLINYIGKENGEQLKSTTYSGSKSRTVPFGATCNNCLNWSKSKREQYYCNVCDDKRIVDLPYQSFEVPNGTNTSGFNAERIPTLINDKNHHLGLGNGDVVEYDYDPSWWSTDEQFESSRRSRDGQSRNGYSMQFIAGAPVTLGERKKSFLQVRCVQITNDYSTTSNTNYSIDKTSNENKPVDTSFDRFTEFKQLFPCLVSNDLTFNYYQSPFYYFEKKSESGKTIEWRITKDGGLWDFNTDQSKWFWNSSFTCN